MNSDVNIFVSVFTSPAFKHSSTMGYSCACIDNAQMILYILGTNQDLVEYNIALNSISTIASVGVSNVGNCYLDSTSTKNALIVVKNDFVMKEFNLSSLAITDSYATNKSSFSQDPTGTYAAMHQAGQVEIYLVGTIDPPSCLPVFYTDPVTLLCEPCQYGCKVHK